MSPFNQEVFISFIIKAQDNINLGYGFILWSKLNSECEFQD